LVAVPLVTVQGFVISGGGGCGGDKRRNRGKPPACRHIPVKAASTKTWCS